MVASLNGLGALVFTARVGENSTIVREKACAGLTYLDLQLDTNKNNASPTDKNITAANSAVKILVIHTQEDCAITVASHKASRS